MQQQIGKAQIFRFTDACYSLSGDNDDWLGALAREALPLLDYGFGVAAWSFRKGDWAGHTLPRGVDPALGKAMWASAERYTNEELVRLFMGARAVSATERIDNVAGLDQHPASCGFAELGVKDFHALTVWDAAGRGVALAGAANQVLRAPPGQVARLERLGSHLLAGWRLRCALQQVDAVLDPGGRLLHAEGAARSGAKRDALTRAVRDFDQARSLRSRASADESLEAFEGLVAGRWSLIQRFESDGRRYLIAMRNEPGQVRAAALSPNESHALALRAQGLAYKLIGYELGVSARAAFGLARQGMSKLGIARDTDLPLFFRTQVAAQLTKPGPDD